MRNYFKFQRIVIVALTLAALVAGIVLAQQVTPQTQTLPVQLQPAGQANTLQSAWSFTGTGAASAITLTQPAVAGKTQYVTGIEITGAGATGASIVVVTLASGSTTIANFDITVPAGATTAITPLVMEFPQPYVGLGPGQTMVLTVGSFGAGNTNSAANMHGFTQ